MAQFNRISLVSLIALGVAMPVYAQETTPPAAPAEDSGRDVVVVTANKREESVQDIAVAVTAVTAQAREEQGISTITDLTNLTPGLAYTAGNERITLRGIGRNTNNFGANQASQTTRTASISRSRRLPVETTSSSTASKFCAGHKEHCTAATLSAARSILSPSARRMISKASSGSASAIMTQPRPASRCPARSSKTGCAVASLASRKPATKACSRTTARASPKATTSTTGTAKFSLKATIGDRFSW